MLTVSAQVNFQPAGAAAPAGYLVDSGQAFGERGNGFAYGWSADNTAGVRERTPATSSDTRYDTLAIMQPVSGAAVAWEIAVPDGTYRVHVVSGDPAFPTATVKINAEGQSVINGATDPMRPWIDGWVYTTVSDGRLTIAAAAGASNAKLNFVEITDDFDAPPALANFPSVPHELTIGTNLDGLSFFDTIAPFNDLSTEFHKWASTAMPWKPSAASIPLSLDNYPQADASAITFASGYPTGTYQVSYRGTGTVSFARFHGDGAGQNVKLDDLAFTPTQQADGTTTGTVFLEIPEQVEAWFFVLSITGIDKNDPVRDLHIISPDADPAVSTMFRPAFLEKLAAFDGPLRVMDWMQTNNSPLTSWATRTQLSRFSYAGVDKGVPYETWIALANTLHKDLWINIPHKGSDAYVRSLADLIRDTLDPTLKVYLEYSNETWNSSSQAGSYLFNLAANDPTTSGDVVSRAAQEMGKQTVRIGRLFREEFAAAASAPEVRPIVGGFIASAGWAQNALDYIQAHYSGDVKDYVSGVAIAPYVGGEGDLAAINDADLTLDALFAWMRNWTDTTIDGWLKAHKRITDQYEVALESYEGGQHLQALAFPGNEAVKRAAQDDPRMGEFYQHLLSKWVSSGGGIFSNFALATKYSPFGYWGLLQKIGQADSIKYSTMRALAGTTLMFASAPEALVPAAPVAKKPKPAVVQKPAAKKRVAPRPVALPPAKQAPFARKRVARVFD